MILPRQLIYEEKTDIKVFRTHVFGVLEEYLSTIKELIGNSKLKKDVLLKLYNDVCYICTSVYVEQKVDQMIDYYWDIACDRTDDLFYDDITPTRANVVYGIIVCIVDCQLSDCPHLQKLIDAMGKKADWRHIEMSERLKKECFSKGLIRSILPAEVFFTPRLPSKELLADFSLKDITNNYDENCIEDLVCNIGNNLSYFYFSDDISYLLLDAIEEESKRLGEDVQHVVNRIRKELNYSKIKEENKILLQNNKQLHKELQSYQIKCDNLLKENEELKHEVEHYKTQLQIQCSDNNNILTDHQMQKEKSQRQVEQMEQMEQQIKSLRDRLENRTIPIELLADGLKKYAEIFSITQGKGLLMSLSYLLSKVKAWTDNIEELENFLIEAEKENKRPLLSLNNNEGGIIQITESVSNENYNK